MTNLTNLDELCDSDQGIEATLASSQSRNFEKLDVLKDSLKTLAERWRGGPFSSEEREAGDRLIGKLNQVIAERKKEEETAERRLLASAWPCAPDIRHWFPELTAWEGPVDPHPPEGWSPSAGSFAEPPAPFLREIRREPVIVDSVLEPSSQPTPSRAKKKTKKTPSRAKKAKT